MFNYSLEPALQFLSLYRIYVSRILKSLSVPTNRQFDDYDQYNGSALYLTLLLIPIVGRPRFARERYNNKNGSIQVCFKQQTRISLVESTSLYIFLRRRLLNRAGINQEESISRSLAQATNNARHIRIAQLNSTQSYC